MDYASSQWLTSEGLRVSVAAVCARALRGGWRRQLGNDRKARVLITQEAVRATAEQPISPRAKSTDSDVVSSLRAHGETLKADVARLEDDLAWAQARADKATAELAIEKEQARAAQACADQATVELEAERERSAGHRADYERERTVCNHLHSRAQGEALTRGGFTITDGAAPPARR
jgi:hypothetical protein